MLYESSDGGRTRSCLGICVATDTKLMRIWSANKQIVFVDTGTSFSRSVPFVLRS